VNDLEKNSIFLRVQISRKPELAEMEGLRKISKVSSSKKFVLKE